MRNSYYGPDQLLLASKKPHIQELVRQCVHMTDDEIVALPEKEDVRRGLLIIKHLGPSKLPVVDKIADAMQPSKLEQAPEKIYDIYRYCGKEQWVKCGKSEILLQNNIYIAIHEDELFFSNVYADATADEIQQIILFSILVSKGTMKIFKQLEQQRVSNLLKNSAA